MDVLELPRPVINFMRSISKEMHRYKLHWDMYGASDSVSLTLTWRLNCDPIDTDKSRKQHQQKLNDLMQSTRSSSSDTYQEVNNTKKNSSNLPTPNTAITNTSLNATPTNGSRKKYVKSKKQLQHFKLDELLGDRKLDHNFNMKMNYLNEKAFKKAKDTSFRRNLSAESLHSKLFLNIFKKIKDLTNFFFEKSKHRLI